MSFKIGYFGCRFHGPGIIGGNLARGFQQLGVSFEPYTANLNYDFVFVFGCAWHAGNPDHNYDDIEKIEGKIVFCDTSEWGWWTHSEHWKGIFYSTFAPEAIKCKNQGYKKLIDFLKGKSYPFFIREYYKKVQYHQNYHPIDYAIETYKIPQKVPTTLDEYQNRFFDFHVILGDSHPTRKNLIEEINKLPFKIHAIWGSDRKIPQHEYFHGIENAKMSITYDGYGSGGFREMEVLSRTLLLKNSNASNVQRNALVNGKDFVEYQMIESFDDNKYPSFKSTNVGDVMAERLKKLEESFEIYRNGYNHCMQYFTEPATAQYVIDTISKHDWNVITSEEVQFLP